ncbi:MAG: TonB family protein [Terracidiphilus sp.]
MSARAEISNNAQSPQAEISASKGMAVALIGPNDAHRQIVARALASSQGRKIHEFNDYPGTLSDLPRMVGQDFDVVLVDVDTDESYALQIIEKLAEIGQTVMAYSARTDQELLMSCMRAGARDFLPLPTEPGQEQSRPEPHSAPPAKPAAAVAAPQAAPRQVEPKPAPLPPAATARAMVTPMVPEKHIEPASEPWAVRVKEEHRAPEIAQVIEEITVSAAPAASDHEKPLSEFAEWDAANLRRAPVPPPQPVRRPEARPRPALVPERKKVEAASRPIPGAVSIPDAASLAAIERPPVAVDLFRSSHAQTDSQPDEEAEKRGANWIKWILIAAGPVVLGLILLVVFTRPSSQTPAATQPKQQSAPVQSQPETVVAPVANPVAKPTAGIAIAKPSPASAPIPSDETESASSEPVSPDAMAAQLVAPTRIAGQIKKPAPPDEPPPAAPGPVALEDNNVIPGSVFGNANRGKVTSHVVAISAGVADGMIIHKTPPVYPKFAQEAHVTGKVLLKATITKQGTIEGVQVLSGPKMLAPAAVDAVRTWKYKPYMLDNQPVSVETNITVVFGSGGK